MLANEPALRFDKQITCADLGGRMLCCGKWSDVQYGQKHGHPTCGRIADHSSLHTIGWKKGRSSGMWYCPECYTWMTMGGILIWNIDLSSLGTACFFSLYRIGTAQLVFLFV